MFQRHATSATILPVFLALFVIGCGAGGSGDQQQAGGEPAADAAPAVDPATAAMIMGRVSFDGAAPAAEPIDMREESVCAEKHPDGAVREQVVVNDGMLKNVFVYVKEGITGSFPAPQQAAVLDQDGCVYEPHVLGLQAGQTLTLKNSDGILHNINAKPTQNRGFNISQPTTMETNRSFSTPEVMVPVECDVHGWMRAYVGVVSHPYFAVSGDDGSFTIPNLPPGDYVLEAWHERYGTQTMNVTVAASEHKDVQFTFSESMAANAVVPLGEPIRPHDHPAAHQGHGTASGAAGR